MSPVYRSRRRIPCSPAAPAASFCASSLFPRFLAHCRKRAAFSLTELLLSILIVAVLALLAFSALKSVSAASANSRCISNLRSVGGSLIMYASDHNGLLPPTAGFLQRAWIQSGWAEFLQARGYLSDGAVVFCPLLLPAGLKKGQDLRETAPGTSYSFGHFGYGLRSDHPGKIPPPYPEWNGSWEGFTWSGREAAPIRLSLVPSPSSSIILSDSYGHGYGKPMQSYRYDHETYSWSGVEFRHSGGRTNALFLDGHVEGLTQERMAALLEEENRNAYYFDQGTFKSIR